ncbi:MAG TPA: transglycosylase family protein [Candidatus Saccharimonadales bacterium]|nr:transglycosylase family protein [Candidatus Saccharimonadales bacterium]
MANAQGTTVQNQLESPLATPSISFIPTPTIYSQPSPAPITENKTNITVPSPTPTIYIASTHSTATLIPTATPTPTAIPTPTDTPTPTPTVAPTTAPVVQGSTDIESLFSQYSSQYGISVDELKKIAQCESGFNTNSDTGTYAGMFQFSASTWASVRGLMGLDPNPDLRKNAAEAIHTTAFMLSKGEENAWPNCH